MQKPKKATRVEFLANKTLVIAKNKQKLIAISTIEVSLWHAIYASASFSICNSWYTSWYSLTRLEPNTYLFELLNQSLALKIVLTQFIEKILL